MGLRRRATATSAAALALLLGTAVLAPAIGAQDTPEPVDTDGDGQRDDWDGDGAPDNDDDDPCEWDDKDDDANSGSPDGIPDAQGTPPGDGCEGEGGDLPAQLSAERVRVILSEVFAAIPDVTEEGETPDMFPNIRRLVDDEGNDLGPDWTHLDDLIGEPGVRDLLQEPDDRIDQALLEAEDRNNEQIIDPDDPDRIVLVATGDAMDHTLGQIERARSDLGLVGGSGAELTGPCMGMAWSFDSDGQPLDVAWDWDQAGAPIGFADDPADGVLEPIFTSDNPFRVDVDGAVIYTGLAGGVPDGTGPLDHDWFIEIEFLGFTGTNIDAGGDPNRSGENRNLGAVNLNEDLPAPAKISGLVAVNGQISAPESGTGADDGTSGAVGNGLPFFCIGSGFVDFQGGLPLTAPGVALVFLSSVGMLFNARPAKTWGGV